MGKILFRIFFFLGILVLLFLLGSLLLPNKFEVERSTEIKAPAGQIHEFANDLRSWEQWSAWTKEKDPSLNFSYPVDGRSVGKKAVQQFDGENFGKGSVTIDQSFPLEGVRYTLQIQDVGMRMQGRIRYEPQTEGELTKVIWSAKGEFGSNPLMRYMGFFMDRFVGPDFEEGLKGLKEISEETHQQKKAAVKTETKLKKAD